MILKVIIIGANKMIMKTINDRIFVCTIAIIILCISGCYNETEDALTCNQVEKSYECQMSFGVHKPSFQEDVTRSKDINNPKTDWTNSDTLFILFPATSRYGLATYLSGTKQWIVKFSSKPTSKEGDCYVYYPHGGTSYFDEEYNNFKLSPYTAIYGDYNAHYKFDEDFTLFANLTPMTGRVRFVSNTPTNIKIKGLEWYTLIENSYNTWVSGTSDDDKRLTIDEKSLSNWPITIPIQKQDENGMYTSEYVYGNIVKEYDTFSIIDLSDTETVYFRNNASVYDFLKKGKSGWIMIPNRTEHNGWTKKNNLIKTLASNIDISGVYEKYSYNIGKAVGYGLRCDVDIINDYALLYIKVNHDNENNPCSIFSNTSSLKETLSMDITPHYFFGVNSNERESYNTQCELIFEHHYGSACTRASFSNINLYYFSY